MPRVKKIDRPKEMKIYLPESLYSRIQIELFSELEGRVPYGAQSELFTSLAKTWLEARGVLL